MKLFKNADVYGPEHLGRRDVLVEGGRVARIADHIGICCGEDTEVYEMNGKMMAPGYIDLHVHVTGGGGEQGPASRTPEASLSELLDCGVTTAVGLLGTDGVSRSLENLLAKVRALTEEGITCYMLTGSYGYPPVTLTGSVERDIVLIGEVIGVKTAVSDHRSSNPQGEELIRLGAAARRAGLLAPCCGIVTIHMGSGKGGMEPIFYALEHSDIPAKNLLPTHVNLRGKELLDQGIRFARLGGSIDLTTGTGLVEPEELAAQVCYCLEQGAPLESLTVSSDGYGSQPRFNQAGECVGLTYAMSEGLHQLMRRLTGRGEQPGHELLPLSQALTLITKNPAGLLEKRGVKGCIAPGADADLVVYGEDFEIESVVAGGRIAVWEKRHILKGRFEK